MVTMNMITIMNVIQMEVPITYHHTNLVISWASALRGGPLVTFEIGGSVDRAIAANVSMIKLIQRS